MNWTLYLIEPWKWQVVGSSSDGPAIVESLRSLWERLGEGFAGLTSPIKGGASYVR